MIDVEKLCHRIDSHTIKLEDNCKQYVPLKKPTLKVSLSGGIKYNVHRLLYMRSHPDFDEHVQYRVFTSCKTPMCISVDHFRYLQVLSKESILLRISSRSTISDQCIIASLALDKTGYGKITIGSKQYALHRVIYWLHSDLKKIEDLPENMVVRHKCRSKLCTNIEHLELGTHSENCKDMIRDGTRLIGENNHRAKITEKLAQQIADSWRPRDSDEWVGPSDRAKAFSVSLNTLRHIDNGTSWRHINHPPQKPVIIYHKRSSNNFTCDWELVLNRIRYHSEIDSFINTTCKTACWFWKNNIKNKPRLSICGRIAFASVWAAEYKEKRLKQDEEQARHLCGTSLCVNPDHLILGTAKENAMDKRIHNTAGRKLQWCDVKKIRQSTENFQYLADKFGVNKRYIEWIVKEKCWKPE